MKVLTVLARFGTDQYPRAEQEIAEIFARQLPRVERSVVVVDNALHESVIDEQPGRTLLGGDNTCYEFSAFDRAVAHVGSALFNYDLIHFATSAFNTLYVAYLERFDQALLSAVAARPVCIGHIDCYNEAVELQRCRSQHWARSCFFMLPPAEVRQLKTLVSLADRAALFSGRPEAPFRVDAPLSATYRRYITDWLTGADIGQGVEWHSSFALTEATLPAFERKTLCILNEHQLAVRLRAGGCRLVDVTWLSSQLSRGGPGSVAWHTPWDEQLAGRDRDALVVPPPAATAAV